MTPTAPCIEDSETIGKAPINSDDPNLFNVILVLRWAQLRLEKECDFDREQVIHAFRYAADYLDGTWLDDKERVAKNIMTVLDEE